MLKLTFLTLCVMLLIPVLAYADTFSKDDFQKTATAWKVHCKIVAASSNTRDYLDDDSYRNLVKMGKNSIPSVMAIYQDPKARGNCWWNFLLEDITGNKHAKRDNFSPDAEDRFWFEWWAKQKTK